MAKLTEDQQRQLEEWRERWFKIGTCTDPADRPRAERAITGLYARIGEKPPQFVWTRGPLEAAAVLSWSGNAPMAENCYDMSRAYWICRNKFCEEVLGEKYSKQDSELLDLWSEIAQSCDWFWPYKGVCVLSERPIVCRFNDLPIGQCVIHCPDGPAAAYRDGFAVYAWNGTVIPRAWIMEKDTVDPTLALTWENIEQRRALCEILGWSKVLSMVKTTVIDADPDPEIGTLLDAELPTGKARFLRVHCPTGRDFVLGVPMEMKTALQANAWTYDEDPEEYRKNEVRA